MTAAIFILLVLVLILVGSVVLHQQRDAPDRAELARLQTRDEDYREALRLQGEKDAALAALQEEKARLAAELEHERRSGAEKIKLLSDAEARLKTEFENLANRIFEHKGRLLNEQSGAQLSALLKPFERQLDTFRQRVDEVHQDDTEQAARLLEQVRQLQALSNKVSDEANHLAQAIRGDSKVQGDWGELIVERIFEASGLERGREYDKQVALRAEDGSLKRPDFMVYLPGDKAVVVDSKVSLTAFERYCSLEKGPARDKALAEHVQSVRRHIEGLSGREYAHLLGNRTLDFVLLCIPLEPAYQAALQADPALVYDLARSNVVITGPTTLMITLKLIAQLWRRENENRNAEIIADRAGRLYDQVTLIVEALDDARRKLGSVSESFDLAMKRLKEGRGNLVGRVETLRRLGAKVSKPLPAGTVEEASAAGGENQEDAQ